MALRLLAPYSKTLDWNSNQGRTWSDWMEETAVQTHEDDSGSRSRRRDDRTDAETTTAEDDSAPARRGGASDDGANTYRTVERADPLEAPSWSFGGYSFVPVLGGLGGGALIDFFNIGINVTPVNFWFDYGGVDEFFGTDGVDRAYGLWGDDDIFLFDGNDSGYGGFGNDRIIGGRGDDNLYGQTGNDVLSGDVGDDFLDGGSGNDTLLGGHGKDQIFGGTGHDRIEGGFARDVVRAGDGDDWVEGGDGDDTLWGDEGDDTILGGDGDDQIFGGLGRDLLHGGIGDDQLEGGAGNDVLVGDKGNDVLNGHSGNDKMSGGDGGDLMTGGTGDDNMEGGAGNDRLEGDEGSDELEGGDGNDILLGGADNDFIYGDDGNDNIHGGAGNDHITGGANDAGDIGDYLHGGGGFDVFYFQDGDSGGASDPMDVIGDFTQGGDLIVIEGFFAQFLGEQNGFSNTPGAEAYFEQTQSDIFGDVTNVYVRDGVGLEADLSFQAADRIVTCNDGTVYNFGSDDAISNEVACANHGGVKPASPFKATKIKTRGATVKPKTPARVSGSAQQAAVPDGSYGGKNKALAWSAGCYAEFGPNATHPDAALLENDAFGYAPGDIAGDTLNRLHEGGDWLWRDIGEETSPSGTEKRQTASCRILLADGTFVEAEFSYFLVDDEENGGRFFCATYRNASGTKDAQRAYERLVAALNAYPDPIVVYDEDLKLVFCNDGYAASMSDKPEELVEGIHLEQVLHLAVRDGRYPDAIGREDAWIKRILTPEFLANPFEDVELDGDVHHRLLRSRSSYGDHVVVRLNSTELVRQKREAEAAQARLIAALNAYPAPFVIYDSDDCLVVCNDAYRDSMSSNPEDLKVGMHRTEVARIAIRAGKIASAIGREEEWMSDQHQSQDVEKPVQDLELPGDVHHRLLRSRVENGDLVILRIDTTELVRQRRAFEAAQDRLFAAIRAYPDPFAIYDKDLKLMVWNPAYEEAMAGEGENLTEGTSLRDVLYTVALSGRIPAAIGCEKEWAERYFTSPQLTAPGVEDLELAGDQYHRVVRSRTENGEFVILRLNITEVVRQRRALEEKSVQLENANRDITYMALHDDLTGLGNRRYLAQKFEELVQWRRDNGGEIAALHIDLDRFKNINDTMGHAAGDEVLLEISRRIRTHVAADDIVARIGGDEFVVVLPVSADSDRPETLARALLADLSRPLIFEGKECRFGATVGLARTPLAEVEQLLTTSDLALYKAKRRGRGQLGIFDRVDLEEAQRTKALADDVLRGIEAAEFEPYFQPQVDAATGEVVALEALARWRHPEFGILVPGAFLSVATDLNVAGDIDRLVFEQAITACQNAFGTRSAPPSLSFNVSESRINHHDFDAIRRQVEAYCGQVSFELLETIFLEEQDDASLHRLERLRELGIAIEVDDFGSGRASVVALQRINPDRLKIDRRLVALVSKGSGGLRLLRSLIEIGHALEIGVTAEGVETRDQADILAGLGCDRLQGYYFARPMAFGDLLAFLDKSEDIRSEQVYQPGRRLPPMF
eukprot:g2154.t1